MMNEDRFTFEFCPDTSTQAEEIAGMTYGIKVDLRKACDICRVCSVRARVLKSGLYVSHIFENGGEG